MTFFGHKDALNNQSKKGKGKYILMYLRYLIWEYTVPQLVEPQCYKLEGRGFYSRWGF
jgi:hypothetical protein